MEQESKPFENDRMDPIDRIVAGARHLEAPDLTSLLDFAEFLAARAELRIWTGAAAGLAQLYGEDEPEYTVADHRP